MIASCMPSEINKYYLFLFVDMIIGFEDTQLSVNEDDGSVSLCVMILQPAGAREIEDTTFQVTIATNEGLPSASPKLTSAETTTKVPQSTGMILFDI